MRICNSASIGPLFAITTHMRKLGFIALAIVVAACGAGPAGPSAQGAPALGDPGVTSAQLRAYASLQLETGQAWTWKQHESLGTPMHLSAPRTGKPLLVEGVSAARATVAFLVQNKALFKMRDAQTELSLARSEVDPLAMTHVRFQQVPLAVLPLERPRGAPGPAA